MDTVTARIVLRNLCTRCAGCIYLESGGVMGCAQHQKALQIAQVKAPVRAAKEKRDALAAPGEEASEGEKRAYKKRRQELEEAVATASAESEAMLAGCLIIDDGRTPESFAGRDCPVLSAWDQLEQSGDATGIDAQELAEQTRTFLAQRGVAPANTLGE